jgi:hypothetical protein
VARTEKPRKSIPTRAVPASGLSLEHVAIAPDELLTVTRRVADITPEELASGDLLADLDMEQVAPVLDELLASINRLEDGYKWERDRKLVRERVVSLSGSGWDVGKVTLTARLPGLKSLSPHVDDATLVDAGRSAVAALLRVLSRGHLELAITRTSAHVEASDTHGAAVLRFAKQLVVDITPVAELMPRQRCRWCGTTVVGERPTKRYCSVAHKRAWLRSHQRSPEETT